MRLIPEYEPVDRLYLSFVHDFYNTRFHHGRVIAQVVKAVLPDVEVEIITLEGDIPHLESELGREGIALSQVTLNHDTSGSGFLAEDAPIVCEDDSGKGFGLTFYCRKSANIFPGRIEFCRRLAVRMGLVPSELNHAFNTAAVAVSDDLVLLSQEHFSGVGARSRLRFFEEQFPNQAFVVVPPLADEKTKDIDMFACAIGPKEWIVSEYPAGTEQEESIEPTIEALSEKGHRIHRVPGLERIVFDDVDTIPTYANCVLINDTALVPAYSRDEDAVIQRILHKTGYQVIPIDCRDIILSNGAIHCIGKTLPECVAHTES
jgi:hypothetical protein